MCKILGFGIGDWNYDFGCMASRHVNGAREIQRYSEGKVYRRKIFKGIMINPNIEDPIVKDENIPTTIVTLENIDEASELAVSGDRNLAQAKGSSRLEGDTAAERPGSSRLEDGSSRTRDGNSPQQQLEELNSGQSHASLQLEMEIHPSSKLRTRIRLIRKQV